MSQRGIFRFNRTSTPPSKEENPLSRSTIRLEPTETAPSFLDAEQSRRPVTLETQPTPNTTETGSSYHTELHITEPFEHLVNEVLERRNRRNEEINIETNSETETGLLLQMARPLPSESEEETEPKEE